MVGGEKSLPAVKAHHRIVETEGNPEGAFGFRVDGYPRATFRQEGLPGGTAVGRFVSVVDLADVQGARSQRVDRDGDHWGSLESRPGSGPTTAGVSGFKQPARRGGVRHTRRGGVDG